MEESETQRKAQENGFVRQSKNIQFLSKYILNAVRIHSKYRQSAVKTSLRKFTQNTVELNP